MKDITYVSFYVFFVWFLAKNHFSWIVYLWIIGKTFKKMHKFFARIKIRIKLRYIFLHDFHVVLHIKSLWLSIISQIHIFLKFCYNHTKWILCEEPYEKYVQEMHLKFGLKIKVFFFEWWMLAITLSGPI